MKTAFLNENETKKALSEFILNASRLSMDQKCFEFEIEFSNFQERKDSVLFNSGGSANLALLQSLKNLDVLKSGTKVGFSALTWSTNVMPIIQMGFEPVPIDISTSNLNITSDILLSFLKREPLDALFITNALGFSGDLDVIKGICENENIILLEDNCESLGSELHSGKTGNFGLASTFSFFVAHHMSTIEGGMVCTDNENLAEMLRIVRANGWDRNLTSMQQHSIRKKFRVNNEFEAKYTFYDLGYNLRPTEITGFLGLFQLKYLKENIKKRENNYLLLEKVVKENDDLLVLEHTHMKVLSSFAFPVLSKSPELRDMFFRQFSGAGIEIRPIIAGNIEKQPFYKKYIKKTYDLTGANFVDNCGFYCGNYPDLSHFDLETISSCLRKY